jgi:hypothetical protein
VVGPGPVAGFPGPADEIRGSKRLWRPVLFINFIGPLLYLKAGRK